MNKRIRLLAEQAWDDTKEKFGSFVDDGGEVDFTFLHAFTEKFAELIIEECCGQLYDPNKYSDGDFAKWRIRRHFGLVK
jgi:hypothetical protein